jgi:hypothetical protein
MSRQSTWFNHGPAVNIQRFGRSSHRMQWNDGDHALLMPVIRLMLAKGYTASKRNREKFPSPGSQPMTASNPACTHLMSPFPLGTMRAVAVKTALPMCYCTVQACCLRRPTVPTDNSALLDGINQCSSLNSCWSHFVLHAPSSRPSV